MRDFDGFVGALRAAGRVLLLSHDRPDGDAVGSVVAMSMLLEKAGKRTRCLIADPVPEGLAFLPGSERIEPPGPGAGEAISDFAPDLVVALDAAGRDRIGAAVWESVPAGVPLANLDHHASNTRYGDHNYVEPEAPATGELVYLVAEASGWTVDEAAAVNLYAAISTDTGGFRYPSTSARTMRIAADLVERGVAVGEVNQALYETCPRRRVEALRLMLQGMRFDAGDRCVSVALPLELSRSLGLRQGDTEGVVDVVRSIDTVVVAVLFEELEDSRVRVSARSKSPRASVGEICAVFGGGGHVLAAGARMPGPLEEARECFLAEVSRRLEPDLSDSR